MDQKAYEEAVAWRIREDTVAAGVKAYNDAVTVAGKTCDEVRIAAWKAYNDAITAAKIAYSERKENASA